MSMVRVKFSEVPGSSQVREATFLERDGSRMRLEAESPLPRGASVEVDLGEEALSGEVRHCVGRGSAYEIWIDVAPMSRQPRQRPVPMTRATPSVLGDLRLLNASLISYAVAATSAEHAVSPADRR